MRERAGTSASATRRARGWPMLRLVVPAAAADEIAGLLATGSRGASSEERGAGLTELRVYFDSRAAAEQARAVALRVFERLTVGVSLAAPTVERVADEPWVERYRATLEPFDIGAGFRVVPRAGRRAPSPAAGRISLRLAPGRAFGTGQHATTQLCVELLEARVGSGTHWLDLGCGTGILSLVAAHRGAGEVLALDTDPEAVAVARGVVAANDLRARVRVRRGSLRAAAGRSWDGVVCNISLPFVLEGAAELAALVRAAGTLIASGFLARDAKLAAGALRRAGFRPAAPRTRGEWAALEARRAEA